MNPHSGAKPPTPRASTHKVYKFSLSDTGNSKCWQAALLCRVADCFPAMDQCAFQALLAGLLGQVTTDVRLLEASQALRHVMRAANCIQDDGKADIRLFVAHYYQAEGSDISLDDPVWDLQLAHQLIQALQLTHEVGWHAWQCRP